jgi:FkbM family methyltransferase
VVDVGVGKGTPQLYEAFPNAYHVLVEPLSEHEPRLREILDSYEGKYILTAVGASEQEAVMNVEPRRISMSSILERADSTSTGFQAERRPVPMTTLDRLMEEHGLQPPFGLKIDAEGLEYEVIQGATAFLRETQFVVAEVSVAKRFEKSYSFREFAELMDRNGFYLWDIMHIGGKRFVDAAFRKSDSWHTRELRQQLREQQRRLEQMQNSRTWKLLDRINRARLKIAGRRA